jgi:hypothetical protein
LHIHVEIFLFRYFMNLCHAYKQLSKCVFYSFIIVILNIFVNWNSFFYLLLHIAWWMEREMQRRLITYILVDLCMQVVKVVKHVLPFQGSFTKPFPYHFLSTSCFSIFCSSVANVFYVKLLFANVNVNFNCRKYWNI